MRDCLATLRVFSSVASMGSVGREEAARAESLLREPEREAFFTNFSMYSSSSSLPFESLSSAIVYLSFGSKVGFAKIFKLVVGGSRFVHAAKELALHFERILLLHLQLEPAIQGTVKERCRAGRLAAYFAV